MTGSVSQLNPFLLYDAFGQRIFITATEKSLGPLRRSETGTQRGRQKGREGERGGGERVVSLEEGDTECDLTHTPYVGLELGMGPGWPGRSQEVGSPSCRSSGLPGSTRLH